MYGVAACGGDFAVEQEESVLGREARYFTDQYRGLGEERVGSVAWDVRTV